MAEQVDRIPAKWIRRRDSLIRISGRGDTGTIALVAAFSTDLDTALESGELTGSSWAQLKFTCSSILILDGLAKSLASDE